MATLDMCELRARPDGSSIVEFPAGPKLGISLGPSIISPEPSFHELGFDFDSGGPPCESQ